MCLMEATMCALDRSLDFSDGEAAQFSEYARQYAQNYRQWYEGEFKRSPHRDCIGDWEIRAWELTWRQLKVQGCPVSLYKLCLQAYMGVFYGPSGDSI